MPTPYSLNCLTITGVIKGEQRGQVPQSAAGEGAQNSLTKIFYD